MPIRLPAVLPFALAALLGAASLPAAAQDASVKSRLEARGIQHEVDEDGDFRVTYNFKEEGRTQLVFVSGQTQAVAGFTLREVFSPAGRLDKDGIDGKKALELLADSRTNKLGSWETDGSVLYFVIKLPDSIDAAALESAMDIAASTADDMEIVLSGKRDDL
jgi:hypothetical protein